MKVDIKTKAEIDRMRVACRMSAEVRDLAAAAAVPGRSLLYEISGRVLQTHFDEDGVLACVILRSAMPEGLY